MPGPLGTVWDTGSGIFDKRAGKSGNDVAGAGWLSWPWADYVKNSNATSPACEALSSACQSAASRDPAVFVQAGHESRASACPSFTGRSDGHRSDTQALKPLYY